MKFQSFGFEFIIFNFKFFYHFNLRSFEACVNSLVITRLLLEDFAFFGVASELMADESNIIERNGLS